MEGDFDIMEVANDGERRGTGGEVSTSAAEVESEEKRDKREK